VADVLTWMLEHHTWANIRLARACADLDDDILDTALDAMTGSVRHMLHHITESEVWYVSTLVPGQPTAPPWRDGPFPGFDVILRSLRETGEALVLFADDLTGNDPLTVDLDGTPYQATVAFPLTQAIIHAGEHRTEIQTTLSRQGIEPPTLDAWTFQSYRRTVGSA